MKPAERHATKKAVRESVAATSQHRFHCRHMISIQPCAPPYEILGRRAVVVRPRDSDHAPACRVNRGGEHPSRSPRGNLYRFGYWRDFPGQYDRRSRPVAKQGSLGVSRGGGGGASAQPPVAFVFDSIHCRMLVNLAVINLLVEGNRLFKSSLSFRIA